MNDNNQRLVHWLTKLINQLNHDNKAQNLLLYQLVNEAESYDTAYRHQHPNHSKP